jgi:hypothetical protein
MMFWLLTNNSDILKERLFGTSSEKGNHGESIKEAHFHLDNLPTVSLPLYYLCRRRNSYHCSIRT